MYDADRGQQQVRHPGLASKAPEETKRLAPHHPVAGVGLNARIAAAAASAARSAAVGSRGCASTTAAAFCCPAAFCSAAFLPFFRLPLGCAAASGAAAAAAAAAPAASSSCAASRFRRFACFCRGEAASESAAPAAAAAVTTREAAADWLMAAEAACCACSAACSWARMRASLPCRPPKRPQGSLASCIASLCSASVADDAVPSACTRRAADAGTSAVESSESLESLSLLDSVGSLLASCAQPHVTASARQEGLPCSCQCRRQMHGWSQMYE